MEEKRGGGGTGRVVLDIRESSKNRYTRMNGDLEELDAMSQYVADNQRKSNTRKYVIACAVFASLNSVLLGYGKFLLLCPLSLQFVPHLC